MDGVVTSADGAKLAVRRIGSGTPAVMLHGSGGGLHSWEPVATRLSDEFELWLVARRGYAPSAVPHHPKSFADEIADVRAVLTAAASAHLIGVSYGATLALHAAVALAGDLRSVALYEPPLFAAGPRLRPVLSQYRACLAHGDTAGATRLFLEQVANVPAALLAALGGSETDKATAVGSLHDLEAMAGDSDDLTRWSAVELPTLLMQGADTWEPMPTTMDELARTLPRVERVIWDGQMHFATSAAPELVADTLRDFLRC